jgi:hypothetical protein
MAQRTVQLIIGQILTDEEFRADFLERPIDTLRSLRERGFELTNLEIDALAHTERRLWADRCRVDRRAASTLSVGWGRTEVTAFWRPPASGPQDKPKTRDKTIAKGD